MSNPGLGASARTFGHMHGLLLAIRRLENHDASAIHHQKVFGKLRMEVISTNRPGRKIDQIVFQNGILGNPGKNTAAPIENSLKITSGLQKLIFAPFAIEKAAVRLLLTPPNVAFSQH